MLDKIKEDKTLKILLIASLLFHTAFFVIKLKPAEVSSFSKKNEAQNILLNLIKNPKAKQIVQTVESENKLDVKAKFLSKKQNDFLRETKAARVAKFNVAAKGIVDGQKQRKDKAVKKKKELTLASLREEYMDPLQKAKAAPEKSLSVPALGMKNGKIKNKGLHSSNDYLEELELGDFTQVNTQEFKYFGFYNRIKYKLEKYWGQNIESQADKLLKSGRSIASDQNHLTALMIKINSKGEILNVKIKSTSGFKELDQAAIKSFNQAGPFPNPPKGMLKNNIATIEWGFVVNT